MAISFLEAKFDASAFAMSNLDDERREQMAALSRDLKSKLKDLAARNDPWARTRRAAIRAKLAFLRTQMAAYDRLHGGFEL
jgi:hypothetical protein